jgi:hypothetical protein
MEAEGSFPHSQKPATCPYPEQVFTMQEVKCRLYIKNIPFK